MGFTNRVGEINKTKESLGGYTIIIVEDNGYNDLIVEFQDKYKAKVHRSYKEFKNGNIKNPYHPSVYNVGYFGVGKYKAKENGIVSKEYDEWKGVLRRCYNEKEREKSPTYKDAYICEEWHNFQVFAEWWEENIYECRGEKMQLDKDIFIKNNNIYSPETCLIVPQRINQLFNKSKNNKKNNLPIGVFDNPNRIGVGYCARCRIYENEKSKSVYLGLYNTPEEAFLVYKNFKENYIKQVADEYEKLIPRELYKAMYEYEIEIDD